MQKIVTCDSACFCTDSFLSYAHLFVCSDVAWWDRSIDFEHVTHDINYDMMHQWICARTEFVSE